MLREQLDKTNLKVEETSKAIEDFKTRKNYFEMRRYIINYCGKHYTLGDMNKFNLVVQLAINYMSENRDEFEFSEEYVLNLIKKMEVKISLSKESIIEQLATFSTKVMRTEKPNYSLLNAINDIMDIIITNDEIMSIIDDLDELKMEDLLELYLMESDYDLDNLSEDNKLEIAEKALMDYL